MAAGSLRPQIVWVMAEHRERPLSTGEIYEAVARIGVAGFDPGAQRDRNLVNRELSDLAGMSPESHSKPSLQLLARVGRGRYIFRAPELPLDLALVRECLEPEGVHEKRPPRGRRSGHGRERAADSVRRDLFAVQRGICPGCGIYLPHYLRFEVDHIVALADDGRTEERNLQLLCGYCNRVKGTKGKDGYRLKMSELRADNVATGVMIDEGRAALTGKRLAQYHRGGPAGVTGGPRRSSAASCLSAASRKWRLYPSLKVAVLRARCRRLLSLFASFATTRPRAQQGGTAFLV